MSGAEAAAVLGLISSVIAIIEASRDLYDAANNAKGLHEAFRVVSQNIPLVLNILRDCKKIQEQVDKDYKSSIDAAYKHEVEESAKAVKPIILACEENAQKLKTIFEQVVPGDHATWLERYKKATQAVLPGKKRKVEDLMATILQQLQLLHECQFFKTEAEKRSEDLKTAIEQVTALPSSLPEVDSRYSHSGSGAMHINTGTGTQRIYTQSGGSNNRQYIAETQHFRDDETYSPLDPDELPGTVLGIAGRSQHTKSNDS